MIKGGNLIDWEKAGALLAQQSDDEQVMFLKAFIKECLTWGTNLDVERQLSCVNLELTKEERAVLKMLGYDK